MSGLEELTITRTEVISEKNIDKISMLMACSPKTDPGVMRVS